MQTYNLGNIGIFIFICYAYTCWQNIQLERIIGYINKPGIIRKCYLLYTFTMLNGKLIFLVNNFPKKDIDD